MDQIEKAIKLLIQTQNDVVSILQVNVFKAPSVLKNLKTLSHAMELYNEGVSDALEILKEDR